MYSCFVLYACVTSECIDNPVHLKVSPVRSLLAKLKVSSKWRYQEPTGQVCTRV